MELSDNLLGGRRGSSVAGVVINIILALVLLALVAVLIVTSSFSLCRISGDSMESTLHDGQYVLVGKGGETQIIQPVIPMNDIIRLYLL